MGEAWVELKLGMMGRESIREERSVDPGGESPVAVFITANPIPSHPSPHQILNTLDSLDFLGLPKGTHVFLLHDGLRWTQRLTKVRSACKSYCDALSHALATRENVHIVILSRWGHISQLLRKGVTLTAAEYLLVVQHDLPFVRKVDLASILDFMRHDRGIRHVRFNLRKNLPEGQDAMTTRRGEKILEDRTHFFGQYESASKYSVPLLKTLAWSDNNFLCPRWYLKEIVLAPIGKLSMAPEWAMNGLSSPATHEILGTFIAGTLGDPPVISHTDGRNSSPGDFEETKQHLRYIKITSILASASSPLSFGRRALSLILFRAKISLFSMKAQRLWGKCIGTKIQCDVR